MATKSTSKSSRSPNGAEPKSGAMVKGSRSKRPGISTGAFSFVELVDRVLDDVKRYIPEGIWFKLKYVLATSPEEFRDVVSEATRLAESSLADGGFEAYAALRQVQSLVKKTIGWYSVSPSDRRATAIDRYLQCEETCRETNERLRADRDSPSQHNAAAKVLNLAKTKVRSVLGELTETKYLSCLAKADFGPGAPYLQDETWGDNRSVYYKACGSQTVTREALGHMRLALELNDGWKDLLVTSGAGYAVVDEGEVTSTDKSADIDRVIEKQPSILVWLQKGAGSMMADLLLIIGVDLSTQARNHRAARKGSLDGKTATVDMKSASDLNADALVEWLFPASWYTFLRDLTVRWGKLPGGELHQHHMFSTMGNATTFPIECLVFYSIAWASCVIAGEDTRSIRVYGDDVIIPVGALGLFFETLLYCGHQPNVEKTKVWGPFRESCGRDYVYGIDVRPVYLDRVPSTDMEVMSLYNRLSLMALMPLPSTLQWLRNLGRDLIGPPDLGMSTESAIDALIGSSKAVSHPRRSTEERVLALASDSYYVADPPPPTGFCSSYQSYYWTFRGFTSKALPLEGADDERVKYWCTLYGTRLLQSSHKEGLGLQGRQIPSSLSRTYIPEKYVFWWDRVDSVRTFLFTRRLR